MNALKLILTLFVITVMSCMAPFQLDRPAVRDGTREALEVDIFPEVGKLLSDGRLTCSLVMIETDIALTAAHCIPSEPWLWSSLTVVMEDGATANVVDWAWSDSWNGYSLHSDIAVLFLDADVIAEFLLPVMGDKEVTMSSFGHSILAVGYSSGEKEFVRSWLLAAAKGDMLIFPADPQHLWYGDSGGPTYMIENSQFRLVGINAILVKSYFHNGVLASGSTAIWPYLEWIDAVIAEWRLEQDHEDRRD
jgi:hypothetical protein